MLQRIIEVMRITNRWIPLPALLAAVFRLSGAEPETADRDICAGIAIRYLKIPTIRLPFASNCLLPGGLRFLVYLSCSLIIVRFCSIGLKRTGTRPILTGFMMIAAPCCLIGRTGYYLPGLRVNLFFDRKRHIGWIESTNFHFWRATSRSRHAIMRL